MDKVVRELNKNMLEDFGNFETNEEAKIQAKFIKAFLGYDTSVIEIEN